MSEHIHDWKLIRRSNIHTRFKDARPTRETLIDLLTDPGDSSELWTCPDCGEDRFKFRPGLVALTRDIPEPKELRLKGGSDVQSAE
jgi:hypothetical protein